MAMAVANIILWLLFSTRTFSKMLGWMKAQPIIELNVFQEPACGRTWFLRTDLAWLMLGIKWKSEAETDNVVGPMTMCGMNRQWQKKTIMVC